MAALPKEFPVTEEIKLAILEKSLSNMEDYLKRIDNRLSIIDTRLDKRFDDLNNRLWINFLWTVGFGIGLYGSLFAVVAHALKWF